jgi:hypothetical protein
MSLKEPRQASNCKSRDERHRDKGCRGGGIKTFARDRADAHRNQGADHDQNDRVLSNRGAPFPQSQVRVRIAAALEKRSQTQSRQRGKDHREIAEIQDERLAAGRKTQISLDRVRQDRDSKKKDEIDGHIRNLRREVVSKDFIMREPEHADGREGDDKRAPSRRVEDLGWIGWNLETRCQKRKAEAENQIAECFEPLGKAFAKHQGRG